MVASIRLFNENGLANVRLQQIADDIGISVGNLAYHFKNKEAIVEAIGESLDEECAEVLSAYRLFPNLIDFDHQLTKFYTFAQKYPFFFLDMMEMKRVCPKAFAQRESRMSKIISQIRKRFDFNLQRGIMKSEPEGGVYDTLAKSIWMLISFWKVINSISIEEGKDTPENFKAMIWNLILPHLSETGHAEYEQLIVPLLKKQN